MKWAAIGPAAVATAVVVTTGGNYVLDRWAADGYPVPARFTVVESTETRFGEGVPAGLDEARLTGDGLQVLSVGGRCEVLASVRVEETSETVRVTVRRASLPTDCAADIVPWFVSVDLGEPLGNRTVVDGASARPLPVSDCTVRPAPIRGICAVGPSTE